jgi:hypothetical protein
MYTLDTFLRPLLDSDTRLKIYDSNNEVKHIFNPFRIALRTRNNIVEITSSNRKVSLDFSTLIEAKTAIGRIQEQVSSLQEKYPEVSKPEITNYVNFDGGVKVYKAILNQSGTDAPVATVLVNTLGGTVVWTRDFTGIYSGTLTGVFLANKTLVFLGGVNDSVNGYFSYASSEYAPDAVVVKSFSGGVGVDGLLGDTSISIEVYP